MVLLLHPVLAFLQIQNKDNDDNFCPPSAPSPLAAAEVLFGDDSHGHLFKWVKARGEGQKNKGEKGPTRLVRPSPHC